MSLRISHGRVERAFGADALLTETRRLALADVAAIVQTALQANVGLCAHCSRDHEAVAARVGE